MQKYTIEKLIEELTQMLERGLIHETAGISICPGELAPGDYIGGEYIEYMQINNNASSYNRLVICI